MPERCDRCRFFHPNPPAERPGVISFSGGQVEGGGYCRRKPPVRWEGPHEDARFPLVACEWWCGEYAPRPTES